jgi:AcrR family transcriptional regulator
MVAPPGSAAGRPPRSNRTGRRPGGSGTRDDILEAARKLFAERGYAGATIRAIAQEAGVDGALIHHFFASKEGVFEAAIQDTFSPAEMLPPVLEAGPEGMGERLVRTFLTKWEEPTTDLQLLAVMRSAVSNEEAAQLLRNFLTQELLGRIRQALKGEDAELRATLIGAHLVGVAFLRYVLAYGPIAQLPAESIVDLLSPTIQRYLTEPLAVQPPTALRPVKSPGKAKQPTSGTRATRSGAVKPAKKAPQK